MSVCIHPSIHPSIPRDSDDTPFFDTANGATPSEYPYAPIPNDYTGGDGTTFTWPYSDAEGYYSVFYSGASVQQHYAMSSKTSNFPTILEARAEGRVTMNALPPPPVCSTPYNAGMQARSRPWSAPTSTRKGSSTWAATTQANPGGPQLLGPRVRFMLVCI